jgi:hypothetical protein
MGIGGWYIHQERLEGIDVRQPWCCNGRTQGDVVGGEEVEPNCVAG